MVHALAMLLQPTPAIAAPEWWAYVVDFIDTPAPYRPFSEYLLVLFVLWLLARVEQRKKRRKDFAFQAQTVLEEKYENGELSRDAYEKFRQDTTMTRR